MFCIADQQHLPYSSANFLLFNKEVIACNTTTEEVTEETVKFM